MKMISVIIPTYNGSQYINRVIKSALTQGISDLEIIVVDDNGASSENQIATEKAITENGYRDRIQYIIQEKNRGGAVARNTGAKEAKGDYFVFIDDDDELGKNQLRCEAEMLDKINDKYAGCFCACEVIKDGEMINRIDAKDTDPFFQNYLTRKIWIGTGSVMIRSKVFWELQGYNESYERHQDMEFYSRVLDKYSLYAVNQCAFIRYHTFRNYTTDIKKAEGHFDHYIEGLRETITSISKTDLEKIIRTNYISFASRYIRTRDFKSFFRVIKTKCGGISCVPQLLGIYVKTASKILSGDRYR